MKAVKLKKLGCPLGSFGGSVSDRGWLLRLWLTLCATLRDAIAKENWK